MALVSFHTYPGIGQKNSQLYNYSQSVRIGPLVRCSGQTGMNDDGESVQPMEDQIRLAFNNVDKALKGAGSKGWSQVYAVRSYHTDLDSSFELMVELFKEFMPNHKPVWVAVGVAKLSEGIYVEIEVEAHDDLVAS